MVLKKLFKWHRNIFRRTNNTFESAGAICLSAQLILPHKIDRFTDYDGVRERLSLNLSLQYLVAIKLVGETSPSGTTALVNNMTIAILNSNAHAHVNKHGHYSNYSPCQTFFDLRYALGIHNAQHDDLERFQSRDGLHHYVSISMMSVYITIAQNRAKAPKRGITSAGQALSQI